MKTSSMPKPRYFMSAVANNWTTFGPPSFISWVSNAAPTKKKEPNGLSSVHQFPETLTCAAKLGPPTERRRNKKLATPRGFYHILAAPLPSRNSTSARAHTHLSPVPSLMHAQQRPAVVVLP